MVDWTQVLVAVAVGLPATITALWAAVQGFMNSRKLDHNTALTRAGAVAATTHAKEAATAATEASKKTEELSDRLNGGLDRKIEETVKKHVDPLAEELREHSEQDEANMVEIRNAIVDLKNTIDRKQGG